MPEPDITITPSENGPYIVSGPVKLVAPDGHEIDHPDPMAMCRCGRSSNKPFCDGTHATWDFDGTLANWTAPAAPYHVRHQQQTRLPARRAPAAGS